MSKGLATVSQKDLAVSKEEPNEVPRGALSKINRYKKFERELEKHRAVWAEMDERAKKEKEEKEARESLESLKNDLRR